MIFCIGSVFNTCTYLLSLQIIVNYYAEGIPETKTPEAAASPKNSAAIATQNCEKYAEYRNVQKWIPAMASKPGYWQNTTDCVNVVTLISAGTQAKPKEYPHMALLGYGKDFKKVQWSCGGSLISEKFILSAAVCGNTSIGPARWALLGDLDMGSTNDDAKPVVYEITKIYEHPDFKKPSVNHDIALYELNTTVEMSPYVRPACLHTSTSTPSDTKGSVTGWGTTGPGERRSQHLLKATILVFDDKKCIETFNGTYSSRFHYDSDSMICAGDTDNGRDTCAGDSGGPLQMPVDKQACMWNVFGITSFGLAICGEGDPAVYTKVAHYLDWIQSIVWP